MSGPVTYHKGRFPPDKLDWARIVPLIGPANAEVARYDGVLAAIPNAHVLLSSLTTQEAVLSSLIEGTQARGTCLLREFVPGSGRRAATLGYSELLNIAEGRQFQNVSVRPRSRRAHPLLALWWLGNSARSFRHRRSLSVNVASMLCA